MTNKTNDDQIPESDLKELSAIYADAEKVTVRDEISSKIKKMARDELVLSQKKHHRWYIPMSMAAAIALSVSLYMYNQPSQIKEPIPMTAESTVAPSTEKKIEIVKVSPKAPETESIPSHISELLQSTGKRSEDELDYPSSDELKSWPLKTWASKIKQLQQSGKKEMASRYRKDFAKYHPKQDIDKLIEQLP